MARDLSRYRLAQPTETDYDRYEESHYLPPEVAAYLEMSRRRPYLVRGILAGSLLALAGIWMIWEHRRRRPSQTSRLLNVMPTAV